MAPLKGCAGSAVSRLASASWCPRPPPLVAQTPRSPQARRQANMRLRRPPGQEVHVECDRSATNSGTGVLKPPNRERPVRAAEGKV